MTIQQFNRDFPDNTACLKWLLKERFGKPICPKCGRLNKYHQQGKSSHFVCVCGGHQLSPKKNTIFEKSDTDLYKWFYALYMFSTCKNGVSAKELQTKLGVTYKTAWRIAHQIRKLFAEHHIKLSGTVEADETYIGGRKSGKRGRGAGNKTAVFGMVKRNGVIKAQVVPNVKGNTLQPILNQTIRKGTLVITDELLSYNKVGQNGYNHQTVKHAIKEYVRGKIHTNNIEGFWSQLKRSLDGTHHVVSAKHLQSYVDEFVYRYNHRHGIVFEPLMARVGRKV